MLGERDNHYTMETVVEAQTHGNFAFYCVEVISLDSSTIER